MCSWATGTLFLVVAMLLGTVRAGIVRAQGGLATWDCLGVSGHATRGLRRCL